MPTSPLISYLRIQQATDRQVLAALRTSATSVSAELKRLQAKSGAGTAVRREQLLRSQVAIQQELATLYTRVGDITRTNSAIAAAAGAESILSQSQSLLQNVLSKADYDYLVRSARASASNSLEVLRQRISGSSYIPLADSVWANQRWANSQVNNMINSALARGASAAELAREVRGFVNPNTPGGVRYASMRLARTELNNAFHAAQVKQAQEEPWVVAVRWHLSGSHPKPDECNQYAEKVHMDNGEPGLWDPEEVPSKPHPNCLCYTTPETPDPEEFIEKYLAGEYDEHLTEQGLPPIPDVPASPAYLKGDEALKSAIQDTQRANLNEDHFTAVEGYIQGSATTNKMLRSGDELPVLYQRRVNRLDDAIGQVELSNPTITYRGLEDSSVLGEIFEGGELRDAAFVSTSALPSTAGTFRGVSSSNPIIIQYELPAGHNALAVDAIEHAGESEILLGRNVPYTIRSIGDEELPGLGLTRVVRVAPAG